MKTLVLEPIGGISGNMMIGAFIDLGVDQKQLNDQLLRVVDEPFEMDVKKVTKQGIAGTHVEMKFEEGHVHRHLADIEEIIEGAPLNEKIKHDAKEMFKIIALAEAKAHDVPVEQIHFHEVGAMDSILDIVGVAIAMDLLGIEKVISKPLPRGNGFVKCAHGLMPVPVPATMNIYELKKVPSVSTEVVGEMVTPTGAAIAAYYVEEYTSGVAGSPLKVGYGAGTKDFNVPNLLRASIFEEEVKSLFMLETNIDDMSAEELAPVVELLLDEGALDVFFTPIIMKKGRPATLLSCLTTNKEEHLDLILKNTTTLGVRYYPVERKALDRNFKTLETPYGSYRVKCTNRLGRSECKFEADDIMEISKRTGKSVLEIKEELRAIKNRND